MGRFVLLLYRLSKLIRDRLFLWTVRGAFNGVGRRTHISLPVQLKGVENILIGERVYFGPGGWIQTLPQEGAERPAIEIGDHCLISGDCVISAANRIVLEDEVLIGRGVHISDHSHDFSDPNLPVSAQGITDCRPVFIERGAWLGQGVVVCPGVRIGRGAVVGANSVVTRDVPPHSKAVGAPARVLQDNKHQN